MTGFIQMLRRHAARVLAVMLVLLLYDLAQLPTVSGAERAALAARFRFVTTALPVPPGGVRRTIRPVNPSYAHIQSWISAVGAGVALADIDGDGLANDACFVDTGTNRVIVAPVPGSGGRYAPFALDFSLIRHDATMAPMGCLPGNFDEGPDTGLLVYFWGRTPVLFLRKPHPDLDEKLSAASFLAQDIVPGDQRWYTNAAVLADVDGDGHLDIMLGNYFPDGARVLDAKATTPDVMQHSMSRAFNGGGPRLLLWTGATRGALPSVRYRDVTDQAFPPDTRHGWTLAVGAADIDGSLLPDLYLANDFGPDRFFDNRSAPGHPQLVLAMGQRQFSVPKSKTLGYESYKGMGVEFADIGARGLLDIVVSNITDDYALEESNFVFMNTGQIALLQQGIAPFVDRSEQLGLSRGGWAWDARLADFDNTGQLEMIQAAGFVHGTTDRWPELQELAMANDQLVHDPAAWLHMRPGDDVSGHDRNPFFVRDATGYYVNIAGDLKPDSDDDPMPSRGIAVADSFGDGRLDFAVAHQWGPTIFHRNESPGSNRFLGLRLRLPIDPIEATQIHDATPAGLPPSRPAIGSEALVTLPDGRRRLAEVDGGNGHSGKCSPELHFGLGDIAAGTPILVALRWRDGSGRPHQANLTLTPGWHTILLGTGTGVN